MAYDCMTMSGRLVSLGHDLQVLRELESKQELCVPGVFFSEAELTRCQRSGMPMQSLGAVFASKEALFKALPAAVVETSWFWTDAEVAHDARHAPFFQFHGELDRIMRSYRWRTLLSISHSGDYVSSVVMIVTDESNPA